MKRTLPARPNLEHLKKQAKELLAATRRDDPEARDSIAAYFPGATTVRLTQAQLVLAREYGFDSWKALAAHVEESPDPAAEFIEAAFAGHLDRAKSVWKANPRLRQSPACAAAAGDVEAVKSLLAADPDLLNRHVPPESRPLLCHACFSRLVNDPEFEAGIVETVRFLLEAGADPNNAYTTIWAKEEWRQTPLYGAAGVVNHAGLTKLLLDAGADPNDGETELGHHGGETVYHSCDFPGHNECLRLVLAAGPAQSVKDFCIKRKLDYEDVEGALIFIEYGCNPNENSERTALNHAILRERSVGLIRRLIEAGADPNVADGDGTTPYANARRLGRRDVADLLLELGARSDVTPRDAILIAAAEDDVDEVRRIAREHPEVLDSSHHSRQSEDGMPLGLAGDALNNLARLGHTKGLEALLGLGIDVGSRNSWSETPLHWAACAGKIETVRMLLARGAPLDVRDIHNDGDPIGWACWASQNWQHPGADYPAVVQALLDAGAVYKGTSGSPEVRAVLKARG